MKNILYPLAILLLLLNGTNTLAQRISQGSSSNAPRQFQTTMLHFQKIKRLLNKDKSSNTLEFGDIKGSPYLDQAFSQGKLFIADTLIEASMFRYNIYADELETKVNDQIYGLLKIDNTKLLINNQIILLKNYLTDNSIAKGYFLQLSKGKRINLFEKKTCKLSPAEKAMTPNQKDRAPKFNIYDEYFINTKKNNLIEIKLKKSTILQLMQDEEAQIKEYIKKNDTNFKDQKSITALFNFYNSL